MEGFELALLLVKSLAHELDFPLLFFNFAIVLLVALLDFDQFFVDFILLVIYLTYHKALQVVVLYLANFGNLGLYCQYITKVACRN